jgi:hypothetical protein
LKNNSKAQNPFLPKINLAQSVTGSFFFFLFSRPGPVSFRPNMALRPSWPIGLRNPLGPAPAQIGFFSLLCQIAAAGQRSRHRAILRCRSPSHEPWNQASKASWTPLHFPLKSSLSRRLLFHNRPLVDSAPPPPGRPSPLPSIASPGL